MLTLLPVDLCAVVDQSDAVSVLSVNGATDRRRNHQTQWAAASQKWMAARTP